MKKLTLSRLFTLIIITSAVSACSLSEPRRAEADFGNSVRNMIAQQTYDPEAASRNADQIPAGYDGELGGNVIKTYRKDVAKPNKIDRPVQIRIGR